MLQIQNNRYLQGLLDEEWASPGVKFPNHFCQWALTEKVGRKEYGYESPLTGLWYRKGKICKFVSIQRKITAPRRASKS